MRWMTWRSIFARPYPQVSGVTPLPVLLLVCAVRHKRTRQCVARRHRIRRRSARALVGHRDPRQCLKREEIPFAFDQSLPLRTVCSAQLAKGAGWGECERLDREENAASLNG